MTEMLNRTVKKSIKKCHPEYLDGTFQIKVYLGYLLNKASIDLAALRPEAIALTTKLAPVVASPATNTLSTELFILSSLATFLRPSVSKAKVSTRPSCSG